MEGFRGRRGWMAGAVSTHMGDANAMEEGLAAGLGEGTTAEE